MLVPPTEGLRVAKYAEGAGYAPDQWARALAGVDWSGAELLSDKPRSSVWRAELVVQQRPMTLVIKCEPIDRLKRKLQKLVRSTHAFRHWRGAELLMKHGLRTAEPKAVVYGARDGVEVECLIMEALEGKTVLQHLADGDLSVREEHAVARAVGRFTRAIQARAPNPDCKLSNLIVLEDDRQIAMIDCVGVGRAAELERMLAIQCIEALGVGLPIRRPLLYRALLGADATQARVPPRRRSTRTPGVRRRWREVERLVQAHGDPTPEHNPLGPVGSRPRQAGASIPERE
ncbi:MAG: hypothetical protein ACIARR_06720 [Phycisphaerales bacterium JB059]